MDYYDFEQELTGRLKSKGYMMVEPPTPLSIGFMKQGNLMQTYAVAVFPALWSTDEPNAVFQRTKDWFRSIYHNNGAGLLIFVYDEVPAWALDEIQKGGSGGVTGAAIDLMSNKRWVPSHLGWDREING